MSPSNKDRGFFTDNMDANVTSGTSGLLVPFPKLIEPSEYKRRESCNNNHVNQRKHGRTSHSKLHDKPRRVISTSASPTPVTTATSAPISLPISHIHRTPSELQLEQSLLQAEYTDVMMYARLVRGMTERGAGQCAGHPADDHLTCQGHVLSRKSLMGVVECRQRVIHENGHEEEEEDAAVGIFAAGHWANTNIVSANHVMGDSGWDISYSYEETQQGFANEVAQGGVGSTQGGNPPQHSNLTAHTTLPAPCGQYCREVSTSSTQYQANEEDDDDCVFSFEM